MKLRPFASLGERSGRRVAWLGSIVIAAIVALAVYDIVRSYRETVENTQRELLTQSRVIAEQTARSMQAVDVVLRHLAEQLYRGPLAEASPQALHLYLKEQAVGLVQADGLVVFNPDGSLRALSQLPPEQLPTLNVVGERPFTRLRSDPAAGLVIDNAVHSPTGQWVFPIGRRIGVPGERAPAAFKGAVGAPGRIEYFQQFYRAAFPDRGTRIALLHLNGSLLARHPAANETLGRRVTAIDALLPGVGQEPQATRGPSPIDGADRFAVVRQVPDQPLVVVVSRDASAALAPWRAQAIGTAWRTAALATLAALLLGLVLRQLARLDSARKSVEDSRERYALAAAGADDGIWDWNLVTGLAFESRRARELQGLPLQPEAQPIADLRTQLAVHPDDAARRDQLMQAHLAGETPDYEIEYRVRRADGEYRWIHVRALCIRDAQGQATRIAGSVSDIDARKRAEAALRESEERYALAMTGSNEGHWLWDVPARQIYVSDKLLELFGFTGHGRVMPDHEYFGRLPLHPDDHDRVHHNRNAHLAGLTPRLDHEFRIVDPATGEVRWMHTRAQCFRDDDGQALRMAGSTVDITPRKRVEDALRRSEERYQLAVEGSNQGMWDWDLASDMIFLSPRAQLLSHASVGEPLRSRAEWLAVTQYHPDDAAGVLHEITEHLRGKTPFFEVEYRARHHAGEWRWYRQRGVALRDNNGRAYRVAGSMEDISLRKRDEDERDRLEHQLRQAQKLEAIGTLAGGIAHDFNNILAAILGYGELVQRDAPPGSAMRRHIDAAMGAGARARSLVERILAFSRSGVGERVPVAVQAVVDEALDGLAATLPAGVQLERKLDAPGAGALGDPTQVHQVVLNLGANAVQAMRGQGRLEVSLDTHTLDAPLLVTTTTLQPGRYLRLRVADSGSGIAPALLERIFDPFFTTKEVGVGTGLGLSLVHGIVGDLGGGIAVTSTLGEGACFTVHLPWNCDVTPGDAIDEPPPAPGRGQAILLVDDEEALVRLGEEMLAQLGYEPVGFTSGTAALAAFREDPLRFDLLLSDENMPGLGGSELAAAVRELRPALPVVLMSGFVSPALMARANEAGVAEVLAKPLAWRELARCLAALLPTPQALPDETK